MSNICGDIGLRSALLLGLSNLAPPTTLLGRVPIRWDASRRDTLICQKVGNLYERRLCRSLARPQLNRNFKVGWKDIVTTDKHTGHSRIFQRPLIWRSFQISCVSILTVTGARIAFLRVWRFIQPPSASLVAQNSISSNMLIRWWWSKLDDGFRRNLFQELRLFVCAVTVFRKRNIQGFCWCAEHRTSGKWKHSSAIVIIFIQTEVYTATGRALEKSVVGFCCSRMLLA